MLREVQIQSINSIQPRRYPARGKGAPLPLAASLSLTPHSRRASSTSTDSLHQHTQSAILRSKLTLAQIPILLKHGLKLKPQASTYQLPQPTRIHQAQHTTNLRPEPTKLELHETAAGSGTWPPLAALRTRPQHIQHYSVYSSTATASSSSHDYTTLRTP